MRLFCQAIKAAGSVLLMVGMGNRCRLYVEDSAWQSAVILRKENARTGVHNLVLFYVCPKAHIPGNGFVKPSDHFKGCCWPFPTEFRRFMIELRGFGL